MRTNSSGEAGYEDKFNYCPHCKGSAGAGKTLPLDDLDDPEKTLPLEGLDDPEKTMLKMAYRLRGKGHMNLHYLGINY